MEDANVWGSGIFDNRHFIAESAIMKNVLVKADRYAQSDASVLILGETGTGKGVIARYIHDRSKRKTKPFQTLTCTTMPEGLFESELFGHEPGSFTGALGRKLGKYELANGGTLFLDEIGDMTLNLQVKLLGVLQDGSYQRVGGTKTLQSDVRIIAATNRNLKLAVEQRTFRDDLYYRLNTLVIALPLLKERKDDIPALIDLFINISRNKYHKPTKYISKEARQALLQYSWPGNVRELEHAIEGACIMAGDNQVLTIDYFPEYISNLTDVHHQRQIYSGMAGYIQDDKATAPDATNALAIRGKALPESLIANSPYPLPLIINRLRQLYPAGNSPIAESFVLIVDDQDENIGFYKKAVDYLEGQLKNELKMLDMAPSINVLKPSELPRDRVKLREILKSCILIVADLDFAFQNSVWESGYVMMAYITKYCHWLSGTLLWVTQYDHDAIASRYYDLAIKALNRDPELCANAHSLLRNIPIRVHCANGVPIPVFANNMPAEDSIWWKSLAYRMGENIREQARGADVWITSMTKESVTTDPVDDEPVQDAIACARKIGKLVMKKYPNDEKYRLSRDLRKAFNIIMADKTAMGSLALVFNKNWERLFRDELKENLKSLQSQYELVDRGNKPANERAIDQAIRRNIGRMEKSLKKMN